jgi:hypothetical protein
MVFKGGQTRVVVANHGPAHAILFQEEIDDLDQDVKERIRDLPATNLCTSLNAPEVGEVADILGKGREPR